VTSQPEQARRSAAALPTCPLPPSTIALATQAA
jgi:hypothetical protein